MSKAIDPFEEFLRKKKVELLEQKYRGQRERDEEEPEAVEEGAELPPDADLEQEERLREEMDDFFQSGQSAGAELFHKVKDLSEEKVDEIKDALDDVFEEGGGVPESVEEDADAADTFVNFFKQVQEEFDEDEVCDDASCLPRDDTAVASAPPPPPAPEPAGEPAPDPAPEPEPELAPELAREPSPELAREPQLELEPEPQLPEIAPDLRTAAAEISTEEVEPVLAVRADGRLDLAEILLADRDETELPKRVEVICRLLAKLIERSSLPESEIVEALIRSGVEF